MTQPFVVPQVDLKILRGEISKEYSQVAANPEQGFHFHTGYTLAKILEYSDELVEGVPHSAVASFAGTGNPFSLAEIKPGERVVDVGSGAGFDSLIAARLVQPTGQVIGIDMTAEMLSKARQAAMEADLTTTVDFREGYAEALPVEDGWVDVIISNGVVNLCPDKLGIFREMYRVLKPGGRLQMADILVQKAVPESAKKQIDLWTG